jgi:multiple sugar transport system substrate-binding protein
MKKRLVWVISFLCALRTLAFNAAAAEVDPLVFLSTQLRPIEEAQKMRNIIMRDFTRAVEYITEEPERFPVRVEDDNQESTHAIDVVGALHGELQPLLKTDALAPLDYFANTLKDRGIPESLLNFGKLGGAHQRYVPWMQAHYLMVANKEALAYLPDGADLDALSYDQLGAWANALRLKTGNRLLGFPAGPQGLMHRFLECFLYPSFTGGVVTPFRSEAAETMWTQLASLWESVNPNATNYNFMRQPLLSGDVWIAFDHTARVLDALRQKPDQFIVFPPPIGPKGRGYAPVLAGLAVLKNAPDASGAEALIDYLTQPKTQIATAESVGFFPVVKAILPVDAAPGLKMVAATIEKTQSGTAALPVMLPVGLGQRDRDFDRVFLDAFRRIVLRGETPRAVLDSESESLNRLMSEAGAPCWQPDPPSTAACQAR